MHLKITTRITNNKEACKRDIECAWSALWALDYYIDWMRRPRAPDCCGLRFALREDRCFYFMAKGELREGTVLP